MASALNRTTLLLHQSINTPDYPTVDYIINPDLSSVSGVATKYWKITGDVVSEMDQAEKDTQDTTDLPALKNTRYVEIDTRTGELIGQGFSYASKIFSLSMEAQARLMGLNQVRDDPAVTYPITWNAKDDSDTHDLVDSAAVLGFYLTAVGTYRIHVDGGTTLKSSIRAAANKAAVDAITDTR